MSTPPDNPHDRYFRETFSRPDILADFLNVYLPDNLRATFDLSSLVRELDTYTDETLASHFADLVFTAQVGAKPVRVVLLLEHKSYPEPYIHFQLNRYLLNTWDEQLAQKKPLLPVIPIVVYHGRSRWQKRPIASYFPALPDEVRPYVPQFDYVLIDLSTIFEHLPDLRSDYARLTGVLLQTSRAKKALAQSLLSLADSINRLLATEQGGQFFRTSLIYLNWVTALTKTELVAIFRTVSQQAQNYTMSLYEQLIREGVEQGIEQGVEQANRKAVLAMLRLNMTVEQVAAALELPTDQVRQYAAEGPQP